MARTAEGRNNNRNKKNRSRSRKLRYGLAIALIILVCAGVGYGASYIYPLLWGDYAGEISPERQELWAKGRISILVVGSDRRPSEEVSRSDTIILCYADLNAKTLKLVSIPRDTLVDIDTVGEKTKINHAYAYGGIDLTKTTLENNFAIDPDYYLDVDFEGFKQIIDALGGVTINVPKRMYYPAEGIDLNAGLQTLNGDESLQFVRFRSDNLGDLARISRQQDFLEALLNRLVNMGSFLKLPELSTAILDNVNTDLGGGEIIRLLNFLKQDLGVETLTPPGEAEYQDGISYYILDEEESGSFFAALQ